MQGTSRSHSPLVCVQDKYVWKTKEDADEQEVDLYSKEMYSKINLDIFKDV